MPDRESQRFERNTELAHSISGPLTLSVDCGGGSLKAAVCAPDGTLVSSARKIAVTYPFTVTMWLESIGLLLDEATAAGLVVSRLSVGMPGMIRGGTVVYTPHYITSRGPHTEVDQSLVSQWNGLDAATRLRERFSVPAKVVNDSEMHGVALISGQGLEVALTFGTGLGSAHFLDGVLQAHLELSHAQFERGATYDHYIGEHVRVALGNAAWSERAVEIIRKLFPVFRWDTVYVGGGNAHNLTAAALEELSGFGPSVKVVANRIALSGGPKLWV